MKMLAGLGNPGKRYSETRHNLGFMVLDRIAAACAADFRADRLDALVAKAGIGSEDVLLVKPQTFMNLSGDAVGPLARWHRIEPSCILVVCDDINLEEGRIRFRRSGGDGGHKGLASLIRSLGGAAFPRMRVGVGQPPGVPAEDWVLRKFTPEESGRFVAAAEAAAKAATDWLSSGTEACMNRYNAPGQSGPGTDGSEESR